MKTIDIPARMKHLELDRRGLPIPFIVFRDSDNMPHFTINDTRKTMRCRTADLCAICGRPLFRARWFVGGPGSAFHSHGAYIDPPLHHECMRYAVQACPYLAKENYTKRLDGATLDPAKATNIVGLLDPTVDPNRPPLFIAVMAVGQDFTPNGYFVPKRPYRKIEVWRNGVLLQELGLEQILTMLKGQLS